MKSHGFLVQSLDTPWAPRCWHASFRAYLGTIGLHGYDRWSNMVLATPCGDALYDIAFGFVHVLLLVHILRAAFAGT